jgi:hypothetical protein
VAIDGSPLKLDQRILTRVGPGLQGAGGLEQVLELVLIEPLADEVQLDGGLLRALGEAGRSL